MSDDIILNPHFRDLIDAPHLFDDQDRLPDASGMPGKGLKISEAVPLAELWWEKNRLQMPDFGKPPEKNIVKSGVMRGLPWMDLDKQEKLRVLAQWYAHVGVHRIILGKSSSQDGALTDNLDKLRKSAREILPILDTNSTHTRVDDTLETQTWGYDEISREETLVDAQGATLTKGQANGEPTSKNKG